jgi:hypothetical protein
MNCRPSSLSGPTNSSLLAELFERTDFILFRMDDGHAKMQPLPVGNLFDDLSNPCDIRHSTCSPSRTQDERDTVPERCLQLQLNVPFHPSSPFRQHQRASQANTNKIKAEDQADGSVGYASESCKERGMAAKSRDTLWAVRDQEQR